MRSLILLLFAVGLSFATLAGLPLMRPLWQGKVPGAKGVEPVDKPYVRVFPVEGEAPVPAVIVCPGGGYVEHCDTYEGVDMARWLNERGIAAVVLNYRLSPRYHYPEILNDAQQAVRLVRQHAAEWRIAKDKIGMMGFSAGGHLALNTALREESRPDFLVLVYPAVSLRHELAGEYFRTAALGPNYAPGQVDAYSGEMQDCSKLPPTFVVHSAKDQIVKVANSRILVDRMRAANRQVTFVELQKGLHGLGCGKGDDWAAWLSKFDDWIMKQGLTGRRI